MLVIGYIYCSLYYNLLTSVNDSHKCAFTVKVINVYYINVNIIMNIVS